MTFLQLQNLVAYWLDDPNYGYYSLTQVKLALNNAQKETQKILLQAGENWYVKCVQTPSVSGQSEYELPTDVLKIHRLAIVLSGTAPNENIVPIRRTTLNQQDLESNGTGTPDGYYYKKTRIVIMPASDISNLWIRLHYTYLVADMVNDSDLPDIPTQYHEYPAILAGIDGLLKDGRDASLLLAKKSYYEELMKRDSEDRAEDSPRTVVMTDNGVGGVF